MTAGLAYAEAAKRRRVQGETARKTAEILYAESRAIPGDGPCGSGGGDPLKCHRGCIMVPRGIEADDRARRRSGKAQRDRDRDRDRDRERGARARGERGDSTRTNPQIHVRRRRDHLLCFRRRTASPVFAESFRAEGISLTWRRMGAKWLHHDNGRHTRSVGVLGVVVVVVDVGAAVGQRRWAQTTTRE